MQQSIQILTKHISRSLTHLKPLINQNQITQCLSALCYSAKLLTKFYKKLNIKQNKQPEIKEQHHEFFQLFNQLLTQFGQKDVTSLKRNQVQILDELISYVNQQQFIKFLRDDIYKIKVQNRKKLQSHLKLQNQHNHQNYRNNHQRQPHNNQRQPKQQVTFASQHPFYIEDDDIKEGIKNSRIKIPETILQSRINIKQQQEQQIETNSSKKQQQLWTQIQLAYSSHNIDEAFKLCQQYCLQFSAQTIPANHSSKISTINMQKKTMCSFYNQFNLSGYIHDKTSQNISLSYKIFEQQKQIAIKIQTQCNIPIQNFIAIISEVDLFGEYVPFCYDSRELKTISRNQKIGTSKIYIPLLTDRETYFYAAGYNRIPQCGSIFLFSKTINEDLLYQQKYGFKVPLKSNFVRLQYKFFIVQYIPISKDRAKIRLASKIDLKLNFLPQFILHKSARTFAFDYFKNIIKKSNQFKGSLWQKKMKENPQLYEFFRNQVDNYFLSKG